MECTVSWTGALATRSGMGFVAETGSGHTIVMDGAPDPVKPENGGQNLAPRPMETVLAGTGGCTAYDVVLILKRGRHNVQGCSVKLTSERAEVDPKVFTKIHMHFTVSGKGLPAAAVERGQEVDARSGEVRLDGVVPQAWSPAGEVGQLVVVIDCPDAERIVRRGG